MDPGNPNTDDWLPQTRQAMWSELDRLTQRATGGIDRLAPFEIERLSKLYRAAANHLALLRGFGGAARSTEELNRLVARAHTVVYARVARRPSPWGWLWTLLAFPATVRATARYHALAAAILLLGGIYGYLGASHDPDWGMNFLFPGDERTPFADRQDLLASLRTGRDSEASSSRNAAFAALLWQNNTRVALMCFFVGFLWGIPTVLLLFLNGIHLGTYSYTFHKADLANEWWAWVLPHGVTELLAIVLLAGGGLWLGHMMLAPGLHTRRERLRQSRADVIRLLLFAFPMLLLAALFESFLRQSPLDDPTRYVVAAASAVLWFLFFCLARPPARRLARVVAASTIADRAVALPDRDEILGLLGHSRLASPNRTVK